MSRKIEIFDYLKELTEKRVYYCPNPGNAGDSAIAVGTYQLFECAGLSPEVVRWNEDFDSTDKTIIYGGGGNLAVSYSEACEFIKRHHQGAKKLIVFPQTVQGNGALLRKLGSNVDIFCRERRSFEWVRQQSPRASIYLSDDLAFHLNAKQIVAESEISAWTLARWIVQRPIRGIWERIIAKFEGGRHVALRPAFRQGGHALLRLMRSGSTTHLFAFRTDREKVETPPPGGNVDISRVFPYGTAPRSSARHATQAALAYLDRFDQITTNRLHICIMAALLDKKVDFYANSYFKNKAVFEFSIEGRYPNVSWCGQWEGV